MKQIRRHQHIRGLRSDSKWSILEYKAKTYLYMQERKFKTWLSCTRCSSQSLEAVSSLLDKLDLENAFLHGILPDIGGSLFFTQFDEDDNDQHTPDATGFSRGAGNHEMAQTDRSWLHYLSKMANSISNRIYSRDSSTTNALLYMEGRDVSSCREFNHLW